VWPACFAGFALLFLVRVDPIIVFVRIALFFVAPHRSGEDDGHLVLAIPLFFESRSGCTCYLFQP
jgi:hypothetical protein